jgi:hypothetical protein
MTRLAVALGVAGLVLMIPFDAWYTRALGVLALFGFIVAGVFAIATPAALDAEDDAP